MTVRIYRSTDASAPTLTGQVGSLTSLLDAILVNGYGALTAAGWTIAQTTTNKRGYLQNLTGSNNTSGMLLYVDDTGPGAGAAREARVCGFETMSAITPTGTGQFPTSGQSAIGSGQLAVRKSATADATARAWTCIADGHTVYLFVETGDVTSPVATYSLIFGDFFSYKTSDQYAVGIMARVAENSNSALFEPLAVVGIQANVNWTTSTTTFGHFVARSWTGIGGSIPVGKVTDYAKIFLNILQGGNSNSTTSANANTNFGIGRVLISNLFSYPNGPDGSLWLSPIWINHNNAIRGYYKGLWAPLHDRPLNHNDTFTVSGGNLNGKSFVMQNILLLISSLNDNGQIAIETSDTWS